MKLALLLSLQVGCLWPTWSWYLARLQDGSDEPWGIVALLTIFLLLGPRTSGPQQFGLGTQRGATKYRGPEVRGPSTIQLAAAVLGTSLYAVTHNHLPPLLRAVIAICAVAPLLSALAGSRTIHLPLLGLGLLSLPLIASLQFYLGYPIRALTAALSAQIVSLTGFSVIAEGTNLLWAGETIVVDAPCAGIRMLWTGLYLCFTLAWIRRLSFGRTWLAYSASSLAIFFSNVLRNIALFYVEAKILTFPFDLHAAIGVLCFAVVALAINLIVSRCSSPQVERRGQISDPGLPFSVVGIHLATCVTALLVPLLAPSIHAAPTPKGFPGWPTEFQGREIFPTALSSREIEQLSGFPGRVGRFTDGERELIIRWVTVPTRALHPAADCLRGAGFSTRPLPLQVDADERRWGCVEASREGERYTVCERIFDGEQNSFSDVSAWFWNAVLEKTQGPWWSIAVLERA